MSTHFVADRPPLQPEAFALLPLGAVQPMGWLLDLCRAQAEGLNGEPDDLRLAAVLPLAVLLDDERLLAGVRRRVDRLVEGLPEDGALAALAGALRAPGTDAAERLFVLESLLAARGESDLGDQMERIAYNALPAEGVSDWTGLVRSLWMAAPDYGLAAAVYGPSRVTAGVGAEGAEVTIVEETEYPFRPTVRFTVRAERPVRFPLTLRVPEWAGGATLQIPGQVISLGPGGDHAGGWRTVDREWRSGDSVRLHLPLVSRSERRADDAVTILRGPLVFALNSGEAGGYALVLPEPERAIHGAFGVRESPVGPTPFAPESAPVTLTAKARTAAGPVEEIELIPYGGTTERVAEFPFVTETAAG